MQRTTDTKMILNHTMNPLLAKGNWNIAKGKAKQLMARLIKDDLQFVEGKTDELVGRIQKRSAVTCKGIERSAHMAEEDETGHQ